MRVSIPTIAFDGDVPGSWSNGKPALTFGHLLGWKKNRRATVLWEGQKKVNPKENPMLHELTHAPLKTSIDSIMISLEIRSIPAFKPTDQDGAWPKNFLEALVRSDWRDWVLAVQKETNGWNDNDTTTEIPWQDMAQGATVIPLEELFLANGMVLRNFANTPWKIC